MGGRVMKIVLAGDSIAAGLGVKDRSYGDLLAKELQAEFTNFAESAKPVKETFENLSLIIDLDPDYVILAHGITEAIVRPRQDSLKYLPKRWRKPGWMDPVPYFSRRLVKRFLQKCESAVRWRIKNLFISFFGSVTFMSEQEYRACLERTVQTIKEQTSSKIILLSHSGIDERFYPGSHESLETFKRITKSLEDDRTVFINVSDKLEKWGDYFADHFHPNASGHAKIGEELLRSGVFRKIEQAKELNAG